MTVDWTEADGSDWRQEFKILKETRHSTFDTKQVLHFIFIYNKNLMLVFHNICTITFQIGKIGDHISSYVGKLEY